MKSARFGVEFRGSESEISVGVNGTAKIGIKLMMRSGLEAGVMIHFVASFQLRETELMTRQLLRLKIKDTHTHKHTHSDCVNWLHNDGHVSRANLQQSRYESRFAPSTTCSASTQTATDIFPFFNVKEKNILMLSNICYLSDSKCVLDKNSLHISFSLKVFFLM